MLIFQWFNKILTAINWRVFKAIQWATERKTRLQNNFPMSAYETNFFHYSLVFTEGVVHKWCSTLWWSIAVSIHPYKMCQEFAIISKFDGRHLRTTSNRSSFHCRYLKRRNFFFKSTQLPFSSPSFVLVINQFSLFYFLWCDKKELTSPLTKLFSFFSNRIFSSQTQNF